MPFFEQNETQEVTALLDENGDQLFETIGILALSAAPSNKFAEHTLENGTVISDHKIKLQDRISLQVILNPSDYVEVYKRLKKADQENTRFTIQTRVDTHSNMYIESYPREENGKIANTISLSINFVEQQFVKVVTEDLPPASVKNQSDSDSVQGGDKLPQAETNQTKLDRLLGGLL